MKISNSKKELARIISENGGWRDGAEWSAQDKNHAGRLRKVVFYCGGKPWIDAGDDYWGGNNTHNEFIISDMLIKNWHQTILSRAEYFHLYPAPDAKPRFCESVMRSIPEPEYKPSIEQLMQIHCDRAHALSEKKAELLVAERQESEALNAIKAACKEAGFDISPIENLQENREPELVITDWRDLQVGDEVEYVSGLINSRNGMVGVVVDTEDEGDGLNVKLELHNGEFGWPSKWRFIRRP